MVYLRCTLGCTKLHEDIAEDHLQLLHNLSDNLLYPLFASSSCQRLCALLDAMDAARLERLLVGLESMRNVAKRDKSAVDRLRLRIL